MVFGLRRGKYVPCIQKVQRILLLSSESLLSLCGQQFSSTYCLAEFEVIFLEEEGHTTFLFCKNKGVLKDSQLNSWDSFLCE